MENIGAVIAAAGKSSRMGAFKPLLPLRNSTIIEEIIKTLNIAEINKITVVTGREAALLSEKLIPYGVFCINNPDFEKTDMFYSAKMGLNHIKTKNIFFLPADSPLFKAETLIALSQRANTSPFHIITPTWEGKPGHPVLIKEEALAFLLSYKGQGGLKGAIEAYPGPKENYPVIDPGIIYDADYMEDYKLIKSLS